MSLSLSLSLYIVYGINSTTVTYYNYTKLMHYDNVT